MNFGPACRWVGVRVFPGGAARRHEFRPHPGFDLGVGVFAAALGVGRVRSKVELFEQIRRDRRMEELSTRALAVRHQVHRRTVREALGNAVPLPRKPYVARAKPALGEWAAVIDGWLLADKDAPRKQRHTARRVWQRLVAVERRSR